MKKIIPSILIAITVLQLFAPFSVGLSDKKIEISKNKAEAINITNGGTKAINASDVDSDGIPYINTNDESIRTEAKKLCLNPDLNPNDSTVKPQQEYCFKTRWIITGGKLFVSVYTVGVNRSGEDNYILSIKIKDPDGKNVPLNPVIDGFSLKNQPLGDAIFNIYIIKEDAKLKTDILKVAANTSEYEGFLIKNKTGFSGLDPNINYLMDITLKKVGGAILETVTGGDTDLNIPVTYTDTTKQSYGEGNTVGNTGVDKTNPSALPACGIVPGPGGGTPMGCLAQGLYYLLFRTTSFFFGLTGKVLDFTLMYSLSDASYRSDFVVQGWEVVRDFCNMFFIFVLLYIAFGTILNLNGVKTKEMIINVVIIGLLMNFSLFATRLIIDMSNILARVFYNQNTIVVGEVQKDSQGKPLPVQSALGEFGEIRLSEAIVSKVDPQKLIIESQKIESIKISGATGDEDQTHTSEGITTGSFILIVLLTTAVNLVGIMAFLSSALIFVGRVVMLWLAMILAPLAFFSYTVPALQSVKMVGWKNWWPDTLKMAFVAPVFVFFMYIIVGFMSKGLGLIDASLKTGYLGLPFVVAIVVPFIFIMVLLMKAKNVAVDMSGEIGGALSKAGASVGKFALGAAGGAVLGLGAGALRGTVGALGNKLATSKFAKTNGAIGRGLGDLGKWTGSKSFDVRGTKLGAAAIGGTGINMGKAKEGGYTKHKADIQEKREKRAKSLEVGHDEHEMHDLHQKEEALQGLRNTNSSEIESLDGKIAAKITESTNKSRKATDLEAAAKTDPTKEAEAKQARKEAVEANAELTKLNDEKKAIKDGAKAMVNVSDKIAKRYEDAATKAEDDTRVAQTALTAAQTNAQTTITNATTAAQAEISAATVAAQAAEQAKTIAFNQSISNPSQANTDAYKQAQIAADAAKANIATVTAKTTADLTEITAKAQETVASATMNVAAKQAESTKARTKATELRTHQQNGTKMERSMTELEFEDIPDAKHTVSTINSERKNEYANEISERLFNKSANKHAAHEIRMNSEIKSDGKGH